MTKEIIEIKNLKKYFQTPLGPLHAVDDVSFSIEEGKTLGIVGESGCGKSTLGRVIVRLLEATDGEVIYNNENILNANKRQVRLLRRDLQIIFQDPYSSLNPRMTVKQIIAHPLVVNKIYENKKVMAQRVHELMETVGLSKRTENSYPHELDGGRRQRIGIARALALDPKFIVCDEPVSALDVSIQAQILNLLMDLQEELKITYMFITHDLSVVKHISNDVIVMYLGQCIEKAPTAELFNNPMHPYTKALLASIPRINLSEDRKKTESIQGEITSPINPEKGCRFAPRCKYIHEGCVGQDLPLREVRKGHMVACRLYEK